MVTRRSRLDEFVTGHHPTADLPVQLLCEDHVGSYVIPFPCQYTAGEWVNTATGEGIQGAVVGWREFRRSLRRATHNAAAGQSPKRDEDRRREPWVTSQKF